MMSYRSIWLCFFVLSLGFVVACEQEETKPTLPPPPTIHFNTATPTETSTLSTQVRRGVLPTETPQPTHISSPVPTAIVSSTGTPVSAIMTPAATASAVYNPDTIFSTSLSMSDQCRATDNSYYLQFRAPEDPTILHSPDNKYAVQIKDGFIWLGSLAAEPVQLPISIDDFGGIYLSSSTVHWSPDSQYVVLGYTYDSYQIWLASSDGRYLTQLSSAAYEVNTFSWSTDSQYLAWFSRKSNGDGGYQLIIQSPTMEDPLLIIANDPSINNMSGVGWSFDSAYFSWIANNNRGTEELHIWSALENRETFHIDKILLEYASWSPHGHWLLVNMRKGDTYEQILLGADGAELSRMSTISGNNFWTTHWSPKGDAVATSHYIFDTHAKLIIMNTNGQTFEDFPIKTEFKDMFWLDKGDFFYVKYWSEDNTFLPMLYNAQTGTAAPLIPTNTGFTDKFVLGTNQFVMIHQFGADTWIKMLAVDSATEIILDSDDHSAEQLNLFDNDRYLVFTAWEPNGWQVKHVDTKTGQHQLLQDSMKQVLNLDINEESGTISFWWIGADDTRGMSGFFSDGRPFYMINLSDIGVDHLMQTSEFWSPDRQTAVIKISRGWEKNIVLLTYPHSQEAVVVRHNLGGLGNPYWSPDSQLIAFTQLASPLVSKGIDLEIIDTEGNTLWSFAPFPLEYGNASWGKNTLEWVQCP